MKLQLRTQPSSLLMTTKSYATEAKAIACYLQDEPRKPSSPEEHSWASEMQPLHYGSQEARHAAADHHKGF